MKSLWEERSGPLYRQLDHHYESPGLWEAAMAEHRAVLKAIAAHDSAARFRDLGVDVFLGEGRFAAADAIDVEGARLPFARAVIATGATPVVPPISGLAKSGCLTTESVFDLTERQLVPQPPPVDPEDAAEPEAAGSGPPGGWGGKRRGGGGVAGRSGGGRG